MKIRSLLAATAAAIALVGLGVWVARTPATADTASTGRYHLRDGSVDVFDFSDQPEDRRRAVSRREVPVVVRVDSQTGAAHVLVGDETTRSHKPADPDRRFFWLPVLEGKPAR